MKSEDKIMSNILNNFADKAISDEELEQVSGGTKYQPCPKCGAMVPLGGTCTNCNK